MMVYVDKTTTTVPIEVKMFQLKVRLRSGTKALELAHETSVTTSLHSDTMK